MTNPEINIIVAMAQNRVIGAKNTIPWHIPEDLKQFKKTTMGHGLIMGRKTWESIGHPLPGRMNVVISRNPHHKAKGCHTTASLSEALSLVATRHEKAFIIGGGQIYTQALPLASKIYLSLLHREVAGDVIFPPLDINKFTLQHEKLVHGSEDFTLQIFQRRGASDQKNP